MRKATGANMTPLMEAIKSGDLEKLRLLLDNGHSPNEMQHYTTSDLFQEVQSAIREMFGNGILAKGAIEMFRKVNGGEQEHVQKTPLELAVQENREDMVRLLVERGADLTQNGDELLFAAMKCQNCTMLSYLVEAGVRLGQNHRSVYHLFSYLEGLKNPELLTIVDRLQIDFKRFGGEPLRLDFPDQELIQWAELYSYMDVQEVTWKRKKLLSLMAQMDNCSDYLLLWNPKDKKLWYLDVEHEEFRSLATWEDFIAHPGKYLNGMIIGWEC